MKVNKDPIKHFYQVFHRGRSVGFFLNKKYAEVYAKSFSPLIEGQDYKIEIKKMDFLDEQIKQEEAEEPEEDGFNWDAWKQ
tara:strand:- start:1794 stop:2036 length:243 start_codon:yes stop_codon:yes gene_type:complete